MSEEINCDRRRFLGTAAMTIAAAQLGGFGSANAQAKAKPASPKWSFDDATFDRSAASFDNPDHVAITIHNYRWRLGLAQGEAKYEFSAKYSHRLITGGIGHNLPQEAPHAFADAVVEVAGYASHSS
jgi:hypothetical protein